MLTDGDRAEIMYIVKQYLMVNGIPTNQIPDKVCQKKPIALTDERYENLSSNVMPENPQALEIP